MTKQGVQSWEAAVPMARFLVYDTTLPHRVQDRNRPPQPSCQPRKQCTPFQHSHLCASNLQGWLHGLHSCKVTHSPSPSVASRTQQIAWVFPPQTLNIFFHQDTITLLAMSHQPVSWNNTQGEAVCRGVGVNNSLSVLWEEWGHAMSLWDSKSISWYQHCLCYCAEILNYFFYKF